ncbi:flagellar hook-basal body complex protein [Enterococcus lemanii]|uniref:Flagellar hook protein FlgE n=1 Tax=Enterococcus lemanii TaxID=1159752 RepID=A0ABV9MV51_9ENTE|nr:flagellar hook-basal body complex protein [Enterococcus lemanii]MBM7708063.1 flagellar hook protein FlgE [Enterococcus lemanii]
MLRSLYSGVSGMKNLQTKMDVVSNNIANVNTVGFKSSRVLFQDIMSQTTTSGSSAGNGLGGTNSKQVGLGVQVGSIDTVHSVGAPQTTGRELDFYISGAGYFILRGPGNDANATNFYTRDGAFVRDAEGNITNSGGMKVMGTVANPPMEYVDGFDLNAIPVDGAQLDTLAVPKEITLANGDVAEYKSMSIDSNGLVLSRYGDKTYVVGRVGIATFTNPEGLEKAGSNNYQTSANTGDPIVGASGENGSGLLRSGTLEMSNVDLSTEFTEMIIANRAYQANSRTITTSDEMLQELINLKR